MRHTQKQLFPLDDAGHFERTDAPMPGQPKSDQPRARLEEQIDDNLRRVYQSTLDDPIPDRFLTLIAQLRSKIAETEQDTPDSQKKATPE